jgi:hypothetical protein
MPCGILNLVHVSIQLAFEQYVFGGLIPMLFGEENI